RVLPEPAPATISNGLPACFTASSCCGFKPWRRASADGSLPAPWLPQPPEAGGSFVSLLDPPLPSPNRAREAPPPACESSGAALVAALEPALKGPSAKGAK